MPMIVVRQSIILLFSFFIVVVLNWHFNLEHSHGCDELLVVGTLLAFSLSITSCVVQAHFLTLLSCVTCHVLCVILVATFE